MTGPILVPGKTCCSRVATNASRLIIDSRDYYRAFYREASRAKRSILLAGWQFDSQLELLRGEDASGATKPTAFLPFLEALCREKPELVVFILAWDYSPVFAMEREWWQRVTFDWTTPENLHFCFDGVHALGASHHQKFAVIDGEFAFAGGVDFACARWDDRDHRASNPLRMERGEPQKPYHDMMGFVTGDAARELEKLFAERWLIATGEPLELPPRLDPSPEPRVEEGFEMEADEVAISCTSTQANGERTEAEVLHLYEAAIDSAEQLIYLETQYFTAKVAHDALVRRMQQTQRAPLQVVLVMPNGADTEKERIVLGAAQDRLLASLAETANATGTALRVYSSLASGSERRLATFIHSKLLIVDDRLLCVGSANLTNRSLLLDTELCLAWETSSHRSALAHCIHKVRAELLAEHAGLHVDMELFRAEGLLQRLEALRESGKTKLFLREPSGVDGEQSLHLERLFDPDKPLSQLEIGELISFQTSPAS